MTDERPSSYIEDDDGELRPGSARWLAFAQGIAAAPACSLHAVAIGDGAAALGPLLKGVHILHASRSMREDSGYNGSPAVSASAIADIVEEITPRLILAAATDRGHEFLAHVGGDSGDPDARELRRPPGRRLWSRRERWGGTVLEEVRVTRRSSSRASPRVRWPPGAGTDDGSPPAVSNTSSCRRRRTFGSDSSSRPGGRRRHHLPDARVVVGGGRGVGSAEGFASLEALAKELGAAIGVSRAVTSAGWRPHAEQVGQTGVRIAPDLYIACGVSGASQHMVGCAGAKRILVINTDPDASIIARADQAVIADLHEVVPAIAAEIRRRAGS